eukprot:5522084-Pyramimonas_sp.AAC.1
MLEKVKAALASEDKPHKGEGGDAKGGAEGEKDWKDKVLGKVKAAFGQSDEDKEKVPQAPKIEPT